MPLPQSIFGETFFLVHVENQASRKPEFPKRMFCYFARLYEKYGVPVYPIVLFSYDKPRNAEPTSHRIIFPDTAVLEFNYQVVQLNRLNWRDFLRQPNPIASALMSKMQVAPEDRPQVKLECLRLLATLRLDPARMQLISGFVDTYLRLNAREEAQFTEQLGTIRASEKEQVMQIVTSWLERGLEQGRLEGQRTEALSLILRQLTRRLGPLVNRTQQQIEQLSLTQLETLGEDLLDFTNEAALQQWFAQQQQD